LPVEVRVVQALGRGIVPEPHHVSADGGGVHRGDDPAVAATTGVPRGAKMSIPSWRRRPPSRLAPQKLCTARLSRPSTGNASEAAARSVTV
jgi:hypothetical protein